ncbi:MAG TPA: hypothetical protein VGJ25_01370 [Gaiellaceae bacterium]|jgi:hypothetical protein
MAMLAAALAALTVTFIAPGHTPKIGESQDVGPKWFYTVRVTRAGRPVRALLTMQIVDPLGTPHPVDVGPTTTPILRRPINGRYRDYMIFPPEARGIPLKIRITVVAAGVKRVLTYVVTPRA